MTTQTAAVSLDALGTVIDSATCAVSEDEERLAVAVFRLLAAGHPVTIAAAARAASLPGPGQPPSCDPCPQCSGVFALAHVPAARAGAAPH